MLFNISFIFNIYLNNNTHIIYYIEFQTSSGNSRVKHSFAGNAELKICNTWRNQFCDTVSLELTFNA